MSGLDRSMTGISTAAQSAVWSREEDMADLLAGGISGLTRSWQLAAFGSLAFCAFELPLRKKIFYLFMFF